MGLFRIAALSAPGYVSYKYVCGDKSTRNAAFGAGPESMSDKPGGYWTKTDEELAKSIPASDPPGNY